MIVLELEQQRFIRVGAAQVEQVDDPEKNLGTIVGMMKIWTPYADILCFPEISLSGQAKDRDLTDLHEEIKRQARNTNLWVVYGAYTRRGDQIFNEAYIVDNKGSLRLTCQKQNPWRDEKGVTAGSESSVIHTELGNLGVVICWDLARPENLRRLVAQGAEIVFCPSYWYKGEYRTTEVIRSMPLSRAFENQIFLVYCDAYTQNGETVGLSKICSPTQVLAAAREGQREIITAILDREELGQSRKIFNCWQV